MRPRATARIDLDERSAQGAFARSRAAPRMAAITPTILVAEDDDGMRDMVCEILRTAGYRVIAARDGDEALAIAGAGELQFHCIVTDQAMPGATGTALAAQARLRWLRVPVVMISGQALDDDYLGRAIGPCVAMLRKPFTPDALLHTIDVLIQRARVV
jgi:hypothetical protein